MEGCSLLIRSGRRGLIASSRQKLECENARPRAQERGVRVETVLIFILTLGRPKSRHISALFL